MNERTVVSFADGRPWAVFSHLGHRPAGRHPDKHLARHGFRDPCRGLLAAPSRGTRLRGPWRPPEPPCTAGNLPVELTSFVGRRQGLADLKRALASTRLLTLTGAGGVGKTKLALRAGRESARQYPDGVWFVELAPIQDPELVAQAVFTALGLQDHSSSWSVSTLGDYLADKRPLLILDNCEHVHDAAAVLAGTLLRACPDVRILATSRQALGVTGEVVIDVPTLSLPEDGDASPEALLRSDAVALFVERAGAVQQGFAVDAANAAAILQHLHPRRRHPARARAGGGPARTPSASTRSIGGSPPGSGRWAPATAALSLRQQTLEGAIDWSYQLLSEHERLLWARLSVFAGGFELDAAQAVCAGDGLDAEEIPELVGSLVEKSVLKRRQATPPTASGSSNRFASSAASGSGRQAARQCFRARHRDWIVELATRGRCRTTRGRSRHSSASVPNAPTSGAPSTSASIGSGRGRVGRRDLPGTCGPTGRLRVRRRRSGACTPPCSSGSRHPLGREASSSGYRPSLRLRRAINRPRCRSGTEALAIGRSIGDPEVVAWALQSLGVTAYLTNRLDDAIAYATKTLALARTMGLAVPGPVGGHPAGRPPCLRGRAR